MIPCVQLENWVTFKVYRSYYLCNNFIIHILEIWCFSCNHYLNTLLLSKSIHFDSFFLSFSAHSLKAYLEMAVVWFWTRSLEGLYLYFVWASTWHNHFLPGPRYETVYAVSRVGCGSLVDECIQCCASVVVGDIPLPRVTPLTPHNYPWTLWHIYLTWMF